MLHQFDSKTDKLNLVPVAEKNRPELFSYLIQIDIKNVCFIQPIRKDSELQVRF